MPQLFQVLKCFKCFVFQVHQTKKSNKWECKLCGEKQSIKRHYGLGTGKECRLHVQKLNGMRGEIDEININNTESDEEEELSSKIISCPNTTQSNTCFIQKRESKCSDYVKNESAVVAEDEMMYLDDMQVVLEKPTKYRKLGNNRYKKITSTSVNSRCDDENIPNNQTNTRNSDLMISSQKIKSIDQTDKQNSKKFIVPVKNESKWVFNEKDSKFSKEGMQTIPKHGSSFSLTENVNEIEHTENSYCSITNNNEQTQSKLNSINEIDNKVASTSVSLLQPKINKNSKWAQFTDITDSPNEVVDTKSASIKDNLPQNPKFETLFSLCDDSDLDSVLDI